MKQDCLNWALGLFYKDKKCYLQDGSALFNDGFYKIAQGRY